MRAVIVIRLSRLTDASTSPERQLQKCQELIAQKGYIEVGIAEDLDVSAGKTTPFTRPQLGNWLNHRTDEFDVIVFYRMDRIVRSLLDLADLIRWCQEHKKTIVSATESFLDLTMPYGDIIALLVAKTAEMELAAISARNASSSQYLIQQGRYRGSTPPWGYRPEGEKGNWRLVHDAEQVAIIEEVVRRVLDLHEPLNRIAHDLTRRGVLTPRDRFAELRGREVKNREWSVTPLKRSLLSKAMLGHAISDGKSVRSDDGSPVIRAEPILKPEVLEQLRVELEVRSERGEPTPRTSSLLVRIIYCGICGEPAYKFNGGSHSRFPRFRCKSVTKATKCGNRTIRADDLELLVDQLPRTLLGESERLGRVWDSGSDNSAELADVNDMLTDLTGVLGTGPYKAGTPQRAELDRRIAELSARQDQLSSEVVKPSGWVWQGTGEKFSDWWERQDIEDRNIWLRSMGVRIEFDRNQIRVDAGDLSEMARQVNPTGPIADMMGLFKTMTENGISGITEEIDGTLVPTFAG